MPQPGMKLADKLSKRKEDIRSLYRNGKKRIIVDGVEFSIRRGGPGNNFLIVSPTEVGRLTPVCNFVYDEKAEEKRQARREEQRTHLLKDIPKHRRAKAPHRG